MFDFPCRGGRVVGEGERLLTRGNCPRFSRFDGEGHGDDASVAKVGARHQLSSFRTAFLGCRIDADRVPCFRRKTRRSWSLRLL